MAWGERSVDYGRCDERFCVSPPGLGCQLRFLQSSFPLQLNRQETPEAENICILDRFFHWRTFGSLQICLLQMGLESAADWTNTQLRLGCRPAPAASSLFLSEQHRAASQSPAQHPQLSVPEWFPSSLFCAFCFLLLLFPISSWHWSLTQLHSHSSWTRSASSQHPSSPFKRFCLFVAAFQNRVKPSGPDVVNMNSSCSGWGCFPGRCGSCLSGWQLSAAQERGQMDVQ